MKKALATIERIAHNGHYVIKSDAVKKVYIGYTRREARIRFREESGLKNIEFININF